MITQFSKALHKHYSPLLFWIIVCVPTSLFFIWLIQNSFNMISRDEYRIAGKFLKNYYNAEGFINSAKTLIAPENESRPVVVRLLYVLSYTLTGNVNFQFICILGNLILLGYLFLIKTIIKQLDVSSFYFLPIPFLFLNLGPYLTYLFSYETFFYISSFVVPIYIFYLDIVKKKTFLAIIFIIISFGIGSTALLCALFLFLNNLVRKYYKESMVFGIALFLMIISIPDIKDPHSGNQLSGIFLHFKEITLLVVAFCGNIITIFNSSEFTTIIFGAILLFCPVFLFFTKMRWNNTVHNFIITSIAFMLIMITLNTLKRWREDYNGYLSEILTGHKLIFTLGLFSLIYICVLAGLQKSEIKKRIVGISMMLFALVFYARANFINFRNAIEYQKRLQCDIFNWEASKYIANDEEHQYDFLRQKGIFTPKGSFTPAFVQNLKELAKDTTLQYQPSLFKVTRGQGKNKDMYGVYPQYEVIENSNLPVPSKILHSNGHFIVLIGKQNMFMTACTLNALSIRKLLSGKNPLNPGFSSGFSYLDIPRGDYQIALCTIQNLKITNFGYIGQKVHLW